MGQHDGQKKPAHQPSWEDTEKEEEQLRRWRESAFSVAVEKLKASHGNPDTVMRTGEAFGRGLYSQHLKEHPSPWTIQQWLERTTEEVLKPLGTEFTFTKITDDVATTFLERKPLHSQSKERTIASLFNYSVMRGLFLSAFPSGELLIHERQTTEGQELVFKTHASLHDKFERERVKRTFSSLETPDGA
jgi:hypothetical protein